MVSLVLLTRGADWAIEGVVHLARRTGLPRIVIDATIVSLGTTMPEAFVSVMAAFMGDPGLALGNGVGSIIADTGLIFGLICLLASVPVNRYILDRTGWVQVGSATLLAVIAVVSLLVSEGEPKLSRGVGFFFLVLLMGYMYLTYLWAKQGGEQALEGEERDDEKPMGLVKSVLMVFAGLFLVVVGGFWSPRLQSLRPGWGFPMM